VADTPAFAKPGDLWVTAYYADWHQQSGYLPPEQIDFAAVSHIIHFSIVPKRDGTINTSGGDFITPAQSKALIGPAHAAGCKVLICVGGANTASAFRPALADSVRPQFVKSLVAFVRERGYDGVDIDMEPIEDSDSAVYRAFVRELRTALSAADPRLLLTAATASKPELFAGLRDQFDQINVMTYDLSGPWPGFKTWHNSPLYDDAGKMMSGGDRYPSCDATLRGFVAAGVPRRKLAIGIAFYGYVWTGASAPEQPIEGVKVQSGVDYSAIMDEYTTAVSAWDGVAHSPYFSVASDDPAKRRFVSFDDERLCAEKVAYARREGLGGVMIWELGSGYRAGQPEGRKDVLLQAVKRAWTSPANASWQTAAPKK
jgi:chitinase